MEKKLQHEHGNYYTLVEVRVRVLRVEVLKYYPNNEKENGNYYLGLRA